MLDRQECLDDFNFVKKSFENQKLWRLSSNCLFDPFDNNSYVNLWKTCKSIIYVNFTLYCYCQIYQEIQLCFTMIGSTFVSCKITIYIFVGQYSAVQCGTVLFNTVLYSTVQCNIYFLSDRFPWKLSFNFIVDFEV